MADKAGIYRNAGRHVFSTFVPSHAAATATEKVPVFLVPVEAAEGVKVESVKIVPAASVTGQNTDTTHLNLINAGAAGAGTTELANYDLTDGNDLTGGDAFELYAPATPVEMSPGDVLMLQEEKVNNGLLVPGLLVVTEFVAK